MTYTPIGRGTPGWDAPVNAAFTSQDSRITVNEGQLAQLVPNAPEGPIRHGLLAWNFEPAAASGATAPGAGNVEMMRVTLSAPAVISNVVIGVTAGGSGLTAGQNFAGVYDSSGVKICESVDQSADWAVAGTKTIPMTSPVAVPAGDYYVSFVSNGTTRPSIARAISSGVIPEIISYGETSATWRFGIGMTAATSLPASVNMSTRISLGVSWWVAIS